MHISIGIGLLNITVWKPKHILHVAVFNVAFITSDFRPLANELVIEDKGKNRFACAKKICYSIEKLF